MYTSGTTSHPKGCLISHESLVRTGRIFGEQRFPMRHGDRMWDPLPIFHLASILPFNGCLTTGATYVGLEHFEPGAALRMLEQCTVAFAAFDLIWAAVLDHPDFAATDLSALRLVNVNGVPERLRLFAARTPWLTQISPYGGTEGGGVLALSHLDDPLEHRVGSAGRPFAGMEVRIVDPETGDELPPGEARRDHLPRPGAVRRLLQGPRADRGRLRRRRLLPLRRPRRPRRRRAPELHRAAQGHAQGRRRERRRGRDRGLPRRAPGDRRGPGRGRAGRALPGGAVRLRDAAPGRAARARRADRALPRQDRDLQDPALPAGRRRVADVRHEDPEVQAARADRAELADAGVRSAPKLTAPRP